MTRWVYRLSLLVLLALALESLPYGTVLGGTESWPLTVHRGWVIHRPLAWTFGPLSWLVTPHKVPGFFRKQARAQLLLALFCSLALCKAMSLQEKPWRWASLILLLAMPMGWVRWGPAEILLLITLAAFALAAHDEAKDGGIFYTWLLCLFAVLAGLVKASLIPAGMLCVLAMCRRKKLWPLYTWAVCFAIVWLLCGFNLLGLPQWVWQSLSIVRGYDQAMVAS